MNWIAFLRAINVGGHTVKMDVLRARFEELGFTRVETFIASGNVLFETSEGNPGALAARIEGHLRAALGYEVATFLRSPVELAAIAQYRPFGDEPEAEGASLYVAFLAFPPDAGAQARLDALCGPADALHLHGRELYWLRRNRHESTLVGERLEKALGQRATLRNINTVRRLADKYSS